MATDPHHSHGDDGSGQLNHETTDISLEGIGKLTIGFGAIILVISAALYGSFRLLDRRATAADTSVQRAIEQGRATPTPTRPTLMSRPNGIDEMGRPAAGPRMLTNEPMWLADFRARQAEALKTYAWVDKDAGTVRLPIERAKQLIVERGLPKTAAPAAPEAPADGAAPAEGAAPTPATPTPAPATPGSF